MENEKLWGELRDRSHFVETHMDGLKRKRTGSYYTDLSLTDNMMEELLTHLKNGSKNISEYRFFEPCVGAGNFVFSYIKKVKEGFGINSQDARVLLDNIYVADINENAINSYKKSLQMLVRSYWDISLPEEYFDSHVGTGLLVDVSADTLDYIPLEKVFPGDISSKRFDIVVTNPPYKNLKAERGHYKSIDEYNKDQEKYSAIATIVAKEFKYSTDGVLNLYKLFVEEIIDKYSNDDAYISLLIPSSIMSDKTCEKLRTHILLDAKLISAKAIGEGSGYIDANQALCALLIKKGERTTNISIVKNYVGSMEGEAFVHVGDILNKNTGNAIVAVSEQEYLRLKKLRHFPIVKDLDFIINLRGELDLTAGKKNIVNEVTDYPLLRGRNIGYYRLVDTTERDFVSPEFVKATKKNKYIFEKRIICQQIANMHKERRVTFALAPENYVLGNSCNFITVENNQYGIDIYTLLGLFNTKIIDWLFRLTSSNNHINNYEIDCFPVPVNSRYLASISQKVREYLATGDASLIDDIEVLAEMAYGIVEEENRKSLEKQELLDRYYNCMTCILPGFTKTNAEKVLNGEEKISEFCNELDRFKKHVVQGMTKKYTSLYKGYILNHTTFKLSDLDLEMIKNVPQGGSWKDIPMETVEKSKRLKRITQTGGRTTLYGRIDYSKPSYTITTYFNRPGNGTYVHPVHERVISVREAARFQSFKDDYYFFGNKTQLLKQVGNAVPTVLAYQIGKMITEKTGCKKSIDLFCGAGGMTAGFKAAGIRSVLSNDIEESACVTLKINNPEIPVLCGDITKKETKDLIVKAAIEEGADLICGGPPCQGFSMAGFRAEDDPRNQLFRDFVDIVKGVNPKVIVFENVEGLLSFQGGKTYREVHTLFSELGYNTTGHTLMSNEYAVPQKRKRVILICTRNDLGINPEELYPKPITVSSEKQVTARETIADLENVECTETASYADCEESDILKFFKGKLSYKEYVEGRTQLTVETGELGNIVADQNGQLSFLI